MPKTGNGNFDRLNASRTPEERRKAAKAAGEASAAKRRKLKSWKESVNNLMAGVVTEQDAANLKEQFGLDEPAEKLNQQDLVVAAITRKAKAGDKDCAAFLRDTAGQSPAQLVKVGNLDDKPFEMLDLSSLSDDELRRLAERERPDDAD